MVNVVFNTAFIGDLLLTIPLLRHIKKCAPNDRLILVCRPNLANFFLHNRLVDEVITLDKNSKKSIREMQLDLGARQIRYLICPHASVHSAWLLKDVHAERKISFTYWWNALFFDTRFERPMMLPEPLRLLSLLRFVDERYASRIEGFIRDSQYHNVKEKRSLAQWPHTIAADLTMQVEPEVEYLRETLKSLRLQRPYAILAPASEWATKRWTREGYVSLVAQLAERGLNVYFVGSPREKDDCDEIIKMHHGARVEVRSLAGQTDLRALHAIMSDAEIVIANDSGPMHMAAVAGRPVVAVFGPTTLALGYRPWNDLSYVVQKDMSCRPCGKHGHKKCPIQTHACMKDITLSDVLTGVDDLLKRARPAGSVSPSQTY